MSEHTALREDAQAYVALRQAVRRFLDQYYDDDLTGESPSWPTELENLVGWEAPEEVR